MYLDLDPSDEFPGNASAHHPQVMVPQHLIAAVSNKIVIDLKRSRMCVTMFDMF